MFLHLGNDITLCSKEIIGIVAIQKTADYRSAEHNIDNIRSDHLIYVGQKSFHSVVITADNKVYCSPIEAKTLLKRPCL